MKNIEFRKRVDPETRKKIGKGVKTHYDKKGRKKKIGLALGAAGLAGAGLLAIKKRGSKPGLGTPQNPYVERVTTPTLDSKTTTSSIKESFYDLMGKFRRKGQFMPKGQGEPMVGSRKQVIKVKPGYSRDKYRPKDWTTIDVESKRFSKLVPYTVNFQKDEDLVYTVPTKIQSLVKDSIERINFAKEEKVDSYTTKRGKRVRSFRRKKKHLLDDKVVLDRYVAQSRIFDKRVTTENAKEVFDAEEKGNKVGKKISTVATPLALYGLGRFALSKNKNAKALFETKIAATNKAIDSLTHAAQKGSYASNLNRVHKLGLEMNSIGEMGQKGLSKNAKAYLIGQRARVADKAIGLTGKAVKGLNRFKAVADVGVDVLAGPTQYKTRTFGSAQVALPTLGSTVRRQVIPSLVIGMPIAVAAQKVAKDRYFKNKDKEKDKK